MKFRGAAAVLAAAVALSACNVDKPPPPPNGTGRAALVPTVPLSVAACEPHVWCIAAGTNPSSTTHTSAIELSAGGRGRWGYVSSPPLPGVILSAAACWTSGCLLGGQGPSGAVDLIVDPTAHVSSLAGSIPGSDVTALACPAPGRCLALVASAADTLVDSTTDSGATWRELAALPSAISAGSTLACATTSACVALGAGIHGATAARTTDGGVHWSLAARPGGLQVFTSVACASTTWCLATVHVSHGPMELLQSVNGGASWTPRPTAVAGPDAVACVPTTCLVGGGSSSGGQLASIREGHAERLLSLAYVPEQIVAVACASAAKCVAVTEGSTVSVVP